MCLGKSEIAFAIKCQILHGLYRTLPSFCGLRRKTVQFYANGVISLKMIIRTVGVHPAFKQVGNIVVIYA